MLRSSSLVHKLTSSHIHVFGKCPFIAWEFVTSCQLSNQHDVCFHKNKIENESWAERDHVIYIPKQALI